VSAPSNTVIDLGDALFLVDYLEEMDAGGEEGIKEE